MIALVIVLAVWLAYGSGFVYYARGSYAKYRPSRVPVCGKTTHLNEGHKVWAPTGDWTDPPGRQHIVAGSSGSANEHHAFSERLGEIPSCYGPMTERKAIANAMLTGLFWPPLVAVSVGINLITGGHDDRPEEVHAKHEAELAKREADLKAAEAELAKATRELEEAKDSE